MKKILGKLGEQIAKKYLETQKLKFLCSNYRTRFGELDLVTRKIDNSSLVFAEVKTRTGNSFGEPSETLTLRQIKRIVTSIHIFLKEKDLQFMDWRLDLIVVIFDMKMMKKEIIHFKNILS